eukprot:924031-Rhodomonas_salina.2
MWDTENATFGFRVEGLEGSVAKLVRAYAMRICESGCDSGWSFAISHRSTKRLRGQHASDRVLRQGLRGVRHAGVSCRTGQAPSPYDRAPNDQGLTRPSYSTHHDPQTSSETLALETACLEAAHSTLP